MIQEFIDISIIAFLLVWFIASILSQLNKPTILNYDRIYILPVCRFFSPKPISKDLIVYAQGLNDYGYKTQWKELSSISRNWWNFLWNPQHRITKTIIALYQQMKPFEEKRNLIHLSTSYLVFLNTATSMFKSDTNVTHVKFMVTKYAGYEDHIRDIVFESNIHGV